MIDAPHAGVFTRCRPGSHVTLRTPAYSRGAVRARTLRSARRRVTPRALSERRRRIHAVPALTGTRFATHRHAALNLFALHDEVVWPPRLLPSDYESGRTDG